MYETKLNQDDLNKLIEHAHAIAKQGREPWPSDLKAIVPHKRNLLYTEACRIVREELKTNQSSLMLAPNEIINKAVELAKVIIAQHVNNIATTIATNVANDLWAELQKQLQEARAEIEQSYQGELAKALEAVDQANIRAELAQQLAAAAEQKAHSDAPSSDQVLELQKQLNQQRQQIAELSTQLSAIMQQQAETQSQQPHEPSALPLVSGLRSC